MEHRRPTRPVLQTSSATRRVVSGVALVLAATVWVVQRREPGGLVIGAVAAFAAATLVADLAIGRMEIDGDRVRIRRLWGTRELARRDVVAVRRPRTAISGATVVVSAPPTNGRPYSAYLPTLSSATRAAELLGVPEFGWGPAADDALTAELRRRRTGGH